MGVFGQGDKSLSPKTQRNNNDTAVRKIIDTCAVILVRPLYSSLALLARAKLVRRNCRKILRRRRPHCVHLCVHYLRHRR